MQTKLTLRMDEKLIQKAKRYSKKRGKSVSKLVADYFACMEDKVNTGEKKRELSPWVRSLYGTLAGSDVSEEDYKRYLEEKYR